MTQAQKVRLSNRASVDRLDYKFSVNHNLYAQLFDLNKDRLDNRFLTVPDGPTLSYKDMDDRSAAMATVLTQIGIKAGDRVVALVDKSADALTLYLACLRAGFVYVPLNPAYSGEEIGYFLGDTDPSLFIFAPDRLEKLQPMAEIAGVANVVTLGADGTGSLAEATNKVVAEKAQESIFHQSSSTDTAVMLYTRGITNRPKAAMLSHHNLASNTANLHEAWRFGPNDVVLHGLYFFHMHGLFVALHPAMANGSELIFLPTFDLATVRQHLERATVVMGVPAQYQQLLNDPEFGPLDCSTIRLFLSGSAPLPQDVFREFSTRTGHSIYERYGVTECGIIATNPVSETPKPGSVGLPLPNVEISITDDSGQPVADGEVGQIHVRGPSVFAGYWQQPDLTDQFLNLEGFFNTGDRGNLSSEGHLILVGREGDRIVSGDNDVYPKEVELILDELDEVVEVAVLGLPHPELGEAVVAFVNVVPDITDNDLEMAIAHRLDSCKLPRAYFLTADMPRDPVGKIQKKLLREEFATYFFDG